MDEAAIYARRWFTLGVLCLSLLVIGIDNTVLNTALPTLVRQLHATTSQLQWIVDGYTLVFAGLLLTAGSLGDRFGRRGALTGGLLVFGLASVGAATSGSPSRLIMFRCVMGAGAAFIMPATLSILTNVFTVARERAKAIAIWSGFSAMGIAVGPLLGGWLLEHFSWGAVFTVNIPVVIAALVGGRLVVPSSKDPSPLRIDPIGAGLSIVGLTSLLWAIIEAPDKGWTSGGVTAAFVVAVVVLVSFVIWELRIDYPMLDVTFFENPRFTAASLAVTLTFFALFGSLFLLTQYLQFVLGLSPIQAGFRVMAFALVIMVAAPTSAKLVERIGTKLVVAAGLLTVAAGLAFNATLPTHAGYFAVVARIVVMALGMGLTMAPATESVMGSLPRSKAGVGSAVNDATRQVGGALGVAVLGSIAASAYTARVGAFVAGKPLPAAASDAATHSLGAALQIGQRIGGRPGLLLADAAREAFNHALHIGVLVAAGVAVLGAVIALVWLPARGRDYEELEVTEPVAWADPELALP